MQKKWKKYRNSGVLIFHTVAIKREYSFLDFITRGYYFDFLSLLYIVDFNEWAQLCSIVVQFSSI